MSPALNIEVIKPGLLSTFQDLGRQGYQHLGVPLNGVMDERAHRMANWLVGNASGEATLEITLLGPQLRFDGPTRIAICGADLSARLNDMPVPLNEAVQVTAGDVLGFGPPKRGIRAYLAVEGGYALEPVMGSTSTNLRAAYGGLNGKPLRKDATIPLRPPPGHTLPDSGKHPDFAPGIVRELDAPLRIVAGREHGLFTQESLGAFGAQLYQITPQSDRMGYRLKGPSLSKIRSSEMLSEAVTAGTVQVPPDGQPIVLMADCQTTGGYPRIAHVVWVDLPRLAQRAPGEQLRFEWIDLAKAQRLAVAQARVFDAMERGRAETGTPSAVRNAPTPNSAKEKSVAMEVRAEIGAVVASISVRVGDTVEAGDALMVLEAMKMEFPIEAPMAATVSSILVSEGDMVEEEQILAHLEPVA